MLPEQLELRFTLDEPYFRRFHEDLVGHCLPGWRLQRRMAMGAVVLGLVLAAAGAALWGGMGVIAGGSLTLFGGAMAAELVSRRGAWLRYQRRRPLFGKEVVFALQEGRLARVDPPGPVDVESVLTGEVHELAHGWRVRAKIVAMDEAPDHEAISTSCATIYLPHDACQPAVSRDAFASLFEGMDVQRLRVE